MQSGAREKKGLSLSAAPFSSGAVHRMTRDSPQTAGGPGPAQPPPDMTASSHICSTTSSGLAGPMRGGAGAESKNTLGAAGWILGHAREKGREIRLTRRCALGFQNGPTRGQARTGRGRQRQQWSGRGLALVRGPAGREEAGADWPAGARSSGSAKARSWRRLAELAGAAATGP